MKTKLLAILIVPVALLFANSTAIAVPYGVLFDADAEGSGKVQEEIYGWDLEARANQLGYIDANGDGIGETLAPVDIVTYQSLGADNTLNNGDTFSESFVLNVENGLNIFGQALRDGIVGNGGYYNDSPEANLYADISLSGYISNHDDGGTATVATDPGTILDDTYWSNFNAGGGDFYVDNNSNLSYDAGTDTLVAQFAYSNSAPVIFTPSVFTGAGAQVNVAFEFSYLNPDYFAQAPGEPDLSTLMGNGWFFSVNQGGIAVSGAYGDTGPDPDQFQLAVQETGFDSRFEAVPEPTTMLLLGVGMLGLAGLGRKKFFKRD